MAIVIMDLRLDGEPVPVFVYGVLAGIALGIEPETVKGIFRAN